MRYLVLRLVVGFLTLAQLAMFVVKMAGVNVGWVWVFVPLWLPCFVLSAGAILWIALDGAWDAINYYWKKQ